MVSKGIEESSNGVSKAMREVSVRGGLGLKSINKQSTRQHFILCSTIDIWIFTCLDLCEPSVLGADDGLFLNDFASMRLVLGCEIPLFYRSQTNVSQPRCLLFDIYATYFGKVQFGQDKTGKYFS